MPNSTQARAKAYDAGNAEIVGRPVTYTTDRPDVVTCDSATGVITAPIPVATPQLVTVTARSGNKSATTTLTVYPAGYTPPSPVTFSSAFSSDFS